MKVLYIREGKVEEREVESLNSYFGINTSNTQVLKSAAGYYIGTLCKADWTPNGQEFWEPYSRESEDYWPTREQAEDHLRENDYRLKF